jgi:hypothetical protein
MDYHTQYMAADTKEVVNVPIVGIENEDKVYKEKFLFPMIVEKLGEITSKIPEPKDLDTKITEFDAILLKEEEVEGPPQVSSTIGPASTIGSSLNGTASTIGSSLNGPASTIGSKGKGKPQKGPELRPTGITQKGPELRPTGITQKGTNNPVAPPRGWFQPRIGARNRSLGGVTTGVVGGSLKKTKKRYKK